MIAMVENVNEDCCVQVKCDASESENVVSTRATLATADCVPPLHRQVTSVNKIHNITFVRVPGQSVSVFMCLCTLPS